MDLFAGCGGFTLGFQNMGFPVIVAVDNWAPAVEVYKLNFQHLIYNLDLRDIHTATSTLKKYKPKIIIGGPPCQDFSQAGKRNENLGRGNLTIAFAEIVSILKPDFFVMENVDQLIKTMKFKEAYNILIRAGYSITIRLLDASIYGVPQKRKRFFVIGERDGINDFLGRYLDINLNKSPLTVREYFKNELSTEFYYRHPWSYKRRAIYSIDEPSATIRGVNRPIPAGYPGHSLDATKDLTKVRPLTTIERARVQTFPKSFKWIGTKTNVEQMIGNAVPVKLSEFIAQCLSQYLKDKNNPRKQTEYQQSNIQQQFF